MHTLTKRQREREREREREKETDPLQSDVLVFPIHVNAHLSSQAATTSKVHKRLIVKSSQRN